MRSKNRVIVGPFKVRWARVGFCAISWFLLIPLGFSVAQSTRFECVRNPGKVPRCGFTYWGPLTQTRKYALGPIATVEVFQRAGDKSTSPRYYVVSVLDQRGRDTEIDRYTSPDEAYADRARWQAYFLDPNASRMARESKGSVGGAVLIAALLALGLGVALNELRSSGRLIIDVDFESQRLTARRTRLLMPAGAPKQFLLRDVADFGLEYVELKNWLASRYAPAERGARIVNFDRHRCKSWITQEYLRDTEVFADGLAELRAALRAPCGVRCESTGVLTADSHG